MSKPNYQQAFEELQRIVADLENGQITVDELSEKVNRASELINICKAKLTTTEDNVKKILAVIEQQEVNQGQEEEKKEEDEKEEEAPEDKEKKHRPGDESDLPF